MPELPEVETIKIGLQKKIAGLKIKKVEILSPKSFTGEISEVEGKIVKGVWRRAKMLGIDLDSYPPLRGPAAISRQKRQRSLKAEGRRLTTLLFHLKMTGQLIYDDGKRLVGGHPTPDMRNEMPNSHTRVIFTFSDGSHLYFNDQRRFGWVKVIENGKWKMENYVGSLGPEPLEKGFTWEILKTNLLRHKSMPIKVAIMDQKAISGVGNIYASEACFDARLDPRKRVEDLGDKEFKALHKGVIRVIKKGIKYGGSTRVHFVDAEGHKGYFLDYAFVYGKDRHPCKICKTEIKKIQLGGRGTYFCPKCQP